MTRRVEEGLNRSPVKKQLWQVADALAPPPLGGNLPLPPAASVTNSCIPAAGGAEPRP